MSGLEKVSFSSSPLPSLTLIFQCVGVEGSLSNTRGCRKDSRNGRLLHQTSAELRRIAQQSDPKQKWRMSVVHFGFLADVACASAILDPPKMLGIA